MKHSAWTGSDTLVALFAFGVLLVGGVIHRSLTTVDAPLNKGTVNAPIPECGWYATLVCTEMSDGEHECHWGKTWRCGYSLSWPRTVVRRPFAKKAIRERYP